MAASRMLSVWPKKSTSAAASVPATPCPIPAAISLKA